MKYGKNVPVKSYQKNGVFIDKIEATHGDTISWEATDSNISIFVPDAYEIFNSKNRIFDVTMGDTFELEVTHKLSEGEIKQYHYAVYHENSKDFAEGNSNPIIIIHG